MLAYMPGVDLAFSTEVFRNSADVFNRSSESLVKISERLLRVVDNMRNSGWQSNAGTAFYEKMDADWADDITRYANLMKCLSEAIKYAAEEFDTLESHVRSVNL